MTIYWHRLHFPCPQCDTQIQITELLAASDKEIVIEGLCIKCHSTWKFKTDMKRILAFCHAADIQTQQEACNQPVRPPLAIPPPLLTDDDKRFLADFHITEGA